ncbi:hypothetical protein [Streptomyces sp. NPDC091215]|uniref:hypothetical protein n=1 Tax=Streptomyces sp. NPDC091215 TaxID=3155192 RepID=UPI00341707B9
MVYISFAAVQSPALSRPRWARKLAAQHLATYVAFNVEVLADIDPPNEPVWSTTDPAQRCLAQHRGSRRR